MKKMIEVKNLKKSFNSSVILQNVNFDVEKGDSIVIIGGSGCGKSTLLRCLNRLIVPDEGEILFDGKNILNKSTDIDAYRRKVGMVYQQFNLFEHLNIMENMILAPTKVLHMPQKDAIGKAEALLDKVGMLSSRYKMPSALSGGQKQRVAIARTLMMEPEVILFDEPTSALDPTMVDEVESVIRKLIDGGMTSVIVTHEMRFARSISNKILFLAEKGVYEEGSPEQIFDAPQKELTRQFIYRSRLFSREITRDTADYYQLASDIRKFMIPYGLNQHQSTGLSYLLEEILVPVFTHSGLDACMLRVGCSDTGIGHRIYIAFPGLREDPLKSAYIDELGQKLAKNFLTSLTSSENLEGIWEITATL